MIRTDIFRRGVPWMLLIKRSGTIETDLNVKLGQKACVALTGLAILAGASGALFPWAWAVSGIGLILIVLLNFGFFAFLARRKGIAFAALALPLHLVYYCCCGLSVVIAEFLWLFRSRSNDAVPATPIGRADPGTQPIPRPAWKGWAHRLSSWRARSR
jgi:hypothetical protein